MSESLNMEDNKKEATKHLVESVKLTFTISSAFGAGLIVYSRFVENLGACFWTSFISYCVALLTSIWCINTIVNKTWDKNEELIYNKHVMIPWIAMTAATLFAIIFMCIFIFTSNKKKDDSQLYLKTENIELKYNQSYDIEYSRDSIGTIQLNVKSYNHR
ncbi:MAG: hypothetical protein VZR09_11705 [Candidatus Gastranaerophilaceae bacterium]|nr:hypothetical protein [Candidatus Gastranaerophilaceae bacterium]